MKNYQKGAKFLFVIRKLKKRNFISIKDKKEALWTQEAKEI